MTWDFGGFGREPPVVELGLVGEDVGVRLGGRLQFRCPTNSPMRAHGTPRRCRRLTLRCLRSCGKRYEDSYRLCYVRGPEGIIIELAEQVG